MLLFESLLVYSKPCASLSNRVEVDGMTVSWAFKSDYVQFDIMAPTKGWVTLGFNSRNDIVGSTLVMMSIVEDQVHVEEHYVHSVGKHQDLGTMTRDLGLLGVSGTEGNGASQFSFLYKIGLSDRYHTLLEPNLELYLVCAYSESDYFDHHSIMRKHVLVTL